MKRKISDFLSRYTKSGAPVHGLGRFSALMKRLGDPQDSIKYVHIAGTNGKGSTVRMLAASLITAGYKTGEFTSPYIYRYNDRIRIDGEEISDSELCSLIDVLAPILENDDAGYSQFEITNALAFLYFAEKKCDIAVLEAGIGGLFDSTNIIKDNVCSVITSVSLDHTAVLGNTVGEIAVQKAGIIKPCCPAVLYPQNSGDVVQVIKSRAQKVKSELIIPDTSLLQLTDIRSDGCSFIYRDNAYRTMMPGVHQAFNAVTAIEAAGVIRRSFPRLTHECVKTGIAAAALPSRCQVIRESRPTVIIDGAHNPDGMRALADHISRLPHSPKVMICGMSADKDWKGALSHIAPYIDMAVCTDGFSQKTVPAKMLAGCFKSAECALLSDACRRGFEYAGVDGLLIIGGSLYLASAIPELLRYKNT